MPFLSTQPKATMSQQSLRMTTIVSPRAAHVGQHNSLTQRNSRSLSAHTQVPRCPCSWWRLQKFYIRFLQARIKRHLHDSPGFLQFCQSDSQCPVLTQSLPFLAALDEFNVGGWDPSTIHQPSLALPHHPKLSSSGLLGALYNQTVITPSGLPASFNLTTICGKFDIAWHSLKYFSLFLKCTGCALRVTRYRIQTFVRHIKFICRLLSQIHNTNVPRL